MYGFSGDKLAVSTYGSTASNLYALPLSVSEVIGITANRTAVVISGNSIYMIKLPEK